LKYFALAAFLIVFAPAVAEETPPIPIPDGFVAQRLDVTKGWVARPKDWFYDSHGTPSGWLWTIAKEDPTKGEYKTGMRIQMLVDFKKHGMTPEAFVRDFVRRKRAEDTVLSDCTESQVNQFERLCLEVLEGKYRIQYSAFWNPSGDDVFISTFGAPAEDWDAVRPIQKVMSNLVIIGADFGKPDEGKK